MNKRIKELVLKAGMEGYPIEGVNTLYGDAAIAKFAQLIIDECAEIAFEQWCESGNYESTQSTIIKNFSAS